MQNKALQSGWKQLASDENEDYLYKSFRVTNFAAGLKFLDAIGRAVVTAGQSTTTHLSADNAAVTVSLNYPSGKPLGDGHYQLALAIDELVAS